MRAVVESAVDVTARWKAKASDDLVHVRTGRYRRSIHFFISGGPDSPSATIGTNVSYAQSLEYGAAPHVIVPKNASVLSWVGSDGTRRFAKSVNHPGNRAYAPGRTSLAEAIPSITARMRAAVAKAIP